MGADMRYTQNRELSWLDFNKRVLQVGEDSSTPVFERLKFVAIYQNNLSEFFMIRVGGLHDLALLKHDVVDNKSKMTPAQQLDAIYSECVPLESLRDTIFADIESQLWGYGIRRRSWESLNDEQRKYAEEYAEKYVMPVLSPQMVYSRHPFPHLQNEELYVVCRLSPPDDGEEPDHNMPREAEADETEAGTGKSDSKKKKKKKSIKMLHSAVQDSTIGIIQIPSMVPRILDLPGDGIDYMLVEELVSHYAPQIFDMYRVSDTTVISVTRNADIDPDDVTYDDDEDYRQHMKKILKRRKRLAPVRMMAQGRIDERLRDCLCKHLELEANQVFVVSSPINLSYVYRIEDKLDDDLAKELLYRPFTPVFPAEVDRDRSMFDQIRDHDIMLSYPFDSMEPFLNLLKEAATDPDVMSIKITLYRLASYSKIAEHLVEAADNGKNVMILLELRARFDEENNIGWAEVFEEAGCAVLYGFEGYKVHSKICQITRRRGRAVEFFTQLSTGNYNEKTARQYTDIALMTCDERIGMEGMEFFNNMAMGNLDGEYDLLWVSPTSLKPSLIEEIDAEIAKAKAGAGGRIIVKCNSVTDLDLIEKLSEASCAGVQIDLIVRGICCILPGVKGKTDNITVTSIVGRLLEHSRIFIIGEGDDAKVYLSSADMMTRNTERRVEIAFPILDPYIRVRICEMTSAMLSDTDRACRLLPDGGYAKVEPPDGSDPFNSQTYFMEEAVQKAVWKKQETIRRKSAAARSAIEVQEVSDVVLTAHEQRQNRGIAGFFRRLFGSGNSGGSGQDDLESLQGKGLSGRLGSFSRASRTGPLPLVLSLARVP